MPPERFRPLIANSDRPAGTDPNVAQGGQIVQAGGQTTYRVTLDGDGLLAAQVQPSGFNSVLSLLDSQGQLVIESEATSPTNPDDQIAQHLPAGTYYLTVAGPAGAGTYLLTTTFTAAVPPGQAIGEGSGAYGLTTADLNGDHHPDHHHPRLLH